MKISNKKGISIIGITALIFYINFTAVASQLIIPATETHKTILFVGNSLTYTNDLPGLVVQLGKENGMEIRAEMAAHPCYTLADHWHDGELQVLLAEKHFDFVVIQQDPTPDSRIMLMNYGKRIKTLCERSNCRLAFFMVWPALSNFSGFNKIIKNYRDAAAAANALLCPVGEVWKKHFLKTNNYSYYSSDKFHPSKKGSGVAAQVIFKTLFKR